MSFPPGPKAQLLLVDDEAGNIRVLASALESDYVLTFAMSGESALQMARSAPQPDLILLDVLMPDMDGFEVCAQLKADPQTADIAVMFVTALDDRINEQKGLQVGAVDYIHKPVSPSVVHARIAMQLELRGHRKFLEDLLERRLEDLGTAQREVNEMVRVVRDREARLRAFMDNSPHALSLRTTDGRYLMVSAKFEEQAGQAAQDIMNMANPGLVMWTHPGSHDAVSQHDLAVLESRVAITRERNETATSGDERSFLDTVFPVFDDKANVIALGAFNVDVTEVVQSRRQANTLRNAIDQASDAVALFDRNHCVVFTNEEYHRCFPHAPSKEEIIGMPLEALLRIDLQLNFHDSTLARTDPEGYIEATLKQPTEPTNCQTHGKKHGHAASANEKSSVMTYADGRTYLKRERWSADGELLTVFTDITARREAERQLELHQAERRRLASEVALAEERERRRIAEDLHDGPVQDLGLTRVKLGSIRASLDDPQVVDELGRICNLLDESIHNVRSLMSDLSPPILYELGLEAALEWLAKRLQLSHEIEYQVVSSIDSQSISTEVSVSMFRAVRELLVNVAKHAHATQVVIEAGQKANQLQITVRDNGCGFDPHDAHAGFSNSGGFGLFSVHERLGLLGGQMDLESDSHGTCVKISAPLMATESDVPTTGQTL